MLQRSILFLAVIFLFTTFTIFTISGGVVSPLALFQDPSGSVTLDWDDNTEVNLAGYYVYRSTTSGSNYQRLTADPIHESTYVDDSLLSGPGAPPCGDPSSQVFYWVVSAVNDAGLESSFSNEVSVTATITVKPCAPQGLSITDISSGNNITIAYLPSPGAFRYLVEGMKNNGSWDVLGTTGDTIFTFKRRGYVAVRVSARAENGTWGDPSDELGL